MKSVADRPIFQHSSWSEQPPIGSPIAFYHNPGLCHRPGSVASQYMRQPGDITVTSWRSPRIALRYRSRETTEPSSAGYVCEHLTLLPWQRSSSGSASGPASGPKLLSSNSALVPLSAESRHSAGRSKNDEIDPCATCAPRPVLAEHGLKDRSLDKPAQSELGSAMVAEMVEHSPNDESAYFVARVCVDF
jgi:hypothetical protein